MKSIFDSKEELLKLTINRLFVLQKLELRTLKHYIVNLIKYNNKNYTYNDINNCLDNISLINSVITLKINRYKV